MARSRILSAGKRALLALALICAATPTLAQQAGTLSSMPFASTPFSGSELIYLVQNGISVKTTIAALAIPGATLGFGVQSALGGPLNGSGGLVGYSGALGTPTQGILTNATVATAAPGTNTTQIASTAFVAAASQSSQYNILTNAALKLLASSSIPANSLVYRQGFYAAGDGGGAYYNYSSSACSLNAGAGDNGSQVQALTSGCWIAVWDKIGLTPYVFGAYGNNTNDDTVAVNAWLAATMVKGVGFCAAGHYKVTSTVNFSWPLTGAVINGAGAINCVLDASATTAAYFTVLAANGTSAFYGAIRDIGFYTAHAGPGLQVGLANFVDAFNSLELTNIYVSNTNTASGSSALQMNYVVQGSYRNLTLVGSNSITNGDALQCTQCVSNNFIGGAFSTASVAVHLSGFSNTNVFLAPDLENMCTLIVSTGANIVSNSFYTPKAGAFLGGCASTKYLSAGGGGGNVIDNPELGGFASIAAAFSGTNTGWFWRSARYVLSPQPTLPATGVAWVNNTGSNVIITFFAGALSQVANSCTAAFSNGLASTGVITIYVAPGCSVTPTYTAGLGWYVQFVP